MHGTIGNGRKAYMYHATSCFFINWWKYAAFTKQLPICTVKVYLKVKSNLWRGLPFCH